MGCSHRCIVRPIEEKKRKKVISVTSSRTPNQDTACTCPIGGQQRQVLGVDTSSNLSRNTHMDGHSQCMLCEATLIYYAQCQ